MNLPGKEKFLVDGHGHPQAIVMGLPRYRHLIERLEELEDALDLKRARLSARSFLSHAEMMRRLKLSH